MNLSRTHLSLVAIAATLLAAARPAAAKEPNLALCDAITLGDKAACRAEATRACTPLSSYAETDACTKKIVAKHDRCQSPAYLQACQRHETAFRAVCAASGESPFGGGGLTVEAWLERVRAYPATRDAYAGFARQWGACFGQRVEGCSADRGHEGMCRDAERGYRATWDDARGSRATEARRMITDAAALAGKGRYLDAIAEARRGIATVEWLRSTHAQASWLAPPGDELAQLRTDAETAIRGYEAAYAAEVAAQRCPKPRGGAALVRRLEPLVRERFASVDDTNQAQAQKTSLVHLHPDGKVVTEREAGRNVLVEQVPMVACIARETTAGKTCLVLELTATRSKAQGAWSDYELLVGGAAEMRCENLR